VVRDKVDTTNTWACRGIDALTFASGVTDGAGRLLDIYILCSRFLF
jgi:hypothetical protein